MDVSLLANTVTVLAAQQNLGFANLLLHQRPNFVSNTAAVSDSPTDQLAEFLNVSASIFDAIAPPPLKRSAQRTERRTLLRKKGRTSRKIGGNSGEDGGEEFWFFGSDGGSFFGGASGGWGRGGGGGGGGGGGWNFGEFGGQNWESSSSRWWLSSNFAYGFIYEVIYWIALSNCVHFAMKKVVRIVANGIGGAESGKVVPMRLTSVC